MVKKYSYKNDKEKYVSKHFKIKEFASISDNKLYSDDVLIDSNILEILEQLFVHMKAFKIVITSGYRTNEHEMSMSKNSSLNGYHTKGMAVDINVWKNASTRYSSKEICLMLENLNWNRGIGIISDTAVHIDSRSSKYYFSEVNGIKSIGISFYKYYGVNTNTNEIKIAINKLVTKGVINNGEYWLQNYSKVEYLDELLIKISKIV